MSTVLAILAGSFVGGVVALGPLTSFWYAMFVSWPIVSQYERAGVILRGHHPARRYMVRAWVNSAITTLVLWACFKFGSRAFAYSVVAFALTSMISSLRRSGFAAARTLFELQGHVTEQGEVIRQADLSRMGLGADGVANDGPTP